LTTIRGRLKWMAESSGVEAFSVRRPRTIAFYRPSRSTASARPSFDQFRVCTQQRSVQMRSFKVYKRKPECMTVIDFMNFSRDLVPFRWVPWWKKRIGILNQGIDERQVHLVRYRQRQRVDLSPAGNHDLSLEIKAFKVSQASLERMNHLDAFSMKTRISGQDDVAAFRQWSPDALKSLAAHHNRFPQRQRLESLEVIREMPRHRVPSPNRSSPVHRGNQRDLKHQTRPTKRWPVIRRLAL
jgi:hypothetical protein